MHCSKDVWDGFENNPYWAIIKDNPNERNKEQRNSLPSKHKHKAKDISSVSLGGNYRIYLLRTDDT